MGVIAENKDYDNAKKIFKINDGTKMFTSMN